MSKSKNLDRICVVVTILAILVTILFMNGESLGLERIIDEDAENYSGNTHFTANDLNGNWDTSRACQISLEGDHGTVKGSGAYFYEGNLVIANPGYYVITGELTDGSIIVEAYDNSKIWILLNGVSVCCSDDACIRINQADKVFLTLAEGTENVLESGDTYSEEALADNTDGVIFAHDDLTINGSGSLVVKGGYEHGIGANDSLVIAGGSISVEAVSDGIHVNDEFCFTGANLTITAGDDAVHSDSQILIADGTIYITKCYEGLEAPSIEMQGGDVTIYPSDDGINANGGSSSMGAGMMGSFGAGNNSAGGGFFRNDGNRDTAGAAEETPASETPAEEFMEGESVPEETASEKPASGDAESSQPASGDAESSRPVSGDAGSGEFADRNAEAEGTGTESTGLGAVAAEAVKARDGKAENAEAGVSESEESETRTSTVLISGGNLTIINQTGVDADGIDSNGDIIITGGTIFVSLSGNGTNNALDYGSENGGSCRIDGGTVIAAGGSSMLEEISDESGQPSITCMLSATAEAGTTLTLKDAEGNVLISEELPCSTSAVTLSCKELSVGETYKLEIGETTEELTLEETAASYGSGQGGMPGGMMGGQMGNQMDGRMGARTGGQMSGNGGFGGHGGRGGAWNSDGNGTTETSGQEKTSAEISETAVDKETPVETGETALDEKAPEEYSEAAADEKALIQSDETAAEEEETAQVSGTEGLISPEGGGMPGRGQIPDTDGFVEPPNMTGMGGPEPPDRPGFPEMTDMTGASETADMTGFPQMPDTTGTSETADMTGFPQMPDTAGTSETADMTGFPQMPDTTGTPEMGGMQHMMGEKQNMQQDMPVAEKGETDTASAAGETQKPLSEYGKETWILLGASGGVLLIGLLAAILYRRRS